MIENAARKCAGRRPARSSPIFSRAAMQWVVGIANMVLILGLFLLAVAKAPGSVRANNARCLEQIASEEHTTLEAFFQNPANQDALAQALATCSR